MRTGSLRGRQAAAAAAAVAALLVCAGCTTPGGSASGDQGAPFAQWSAASLTHGFDILQQQAAASDGPETILLAEDSLTGIWRDATGLHPQGLTTRIDAENALPADVSSMDGEVRGDPRVPVPLDASTAALLLGLTDRDLPDDCADGTRTARLTWTPAGSALFQTSCADRSDGSRHLQRSFIGGAAWTDATDIMDPATLDRVLDEAGLFIAADADVSGLLIRPTANPPVAELTGVPSDDGCVPAFTRGLADPSYSADYCATRDPSWTADPFPLADVPRDALPDALGQLHDLGATADNVAVLRITSIAGKPTLAAQWNGAAGTVDQQVPLR